MRATILQGIVIGIATVIPGVSGGTMALVMGIYEKLLDSVNNIGKDTFKLALNCLMLKKDSLKDMITHLKEANFAFLLQIALGALIAIVVFSKMISYLLTDYTDPTYGFFLGLIIASSYYPIKMLKKFSLLGLMVVVIGTAVPVYIASSVDSEQKIENAVQKAELKEKNKSSSLSEQTKKTNKYTTKYMIMLFLAGTITITASILPGVSGSFILLLFGLYFDVLKAIYSFDLYTLALLGSGCAIGLFTFSRLFSFLLKKYYDLTVCFLIGLMFGSIYGIWPFQNYEVIYGKRINLGPIIPSMDHEGLMTTSVAILLGILSILGVILSTSKVDKPVP